MNFIPTAEQLSALASQTSTQPCHCTLRRCGAWDSVTEADWPAAQMRAAGTLRDPTVDEPTFEEFHPCGTRYDSAEAPIAPRFFPFNRCDIHQCQKCHAHWLRYTEFGGYYIDHRVRRLQPEFIVDAAFPGPGPKA